jgi:hypothetical protein
MLHFAPFEAPLAAIVAPEERIGWRSKRKTVHANRSGRDDCRSQVHDFPRLSVKRCVIATNPPDIHG